MSSLQRVLGVPGVFSSTDLRETPLQGDVHEAFWSHDPPQLVLPDVEESCLYFELSFTLIYKHL